MESRTKSDFSQRERFSRGVSKQWDVNLRPIHIALHQCWLAQRPDEIATHALEVFAIVNHRIEIDAHRRVLADRFDDERKREVDVLGLFPARNDRVLGSGHAPRPEELLGGGLVKREPQGERTRAGVRDTEQVEETGNGHFSSAVSDERLT